MARAPRPSPSISFSPRSPPAPATTCSSSARADRISTDGVTLHQSWERNEDKKLVRVAIRIQVPPEFPAKYHKALVRAADTCSVKKTLPDPPEITTETVVI